MHASDRKTRTTLNMLLAALLLTAQLGASVHAFDHDVGAPQVKVCKTCIGFDQTANGSIDLPPDSRLGITRERPSAARHADRPGTRPVAVRQRGPPGALPDA